MRVRLCAPVVVGFGSRFGSQASLRTRAVRVGMAQLSASAPLRHRAEKVSTPCNHSDMGTVTDLLDRRVYTFAQVDDLLGLRGSTAQRWIDGYRRQGRDYPPVIRTRSTGNPVVTWGEFIECRFLAEYREAGVPMLHMRPVVEKLRAELGTRYPLASAQLWLEPQGREIVARVQDQVGVEPSLWVVRTNDQMLPIDWTPPSHRFQESLKWSAPPQQLPVLVWAPGTDKQVEIDPLRSFGEPVVRGVETAVLAELHRAGDPVEMIAELYELDVPQVVAAIEYEQRRAA